MSRFPATLASEPLNESYGFTQADRLSRTDMEQGTARQRRMCRSGLYTFDLQWPFLPSEFDTVHGWFNWRTKMGANWFWLKVFTDTDYVRLQVRFVKDQVSTGRQGGEWIITAKVEAVDVPTITAAKLDARIGAADPDALPAWPFDELDHHPLNESLTYQLPMPIVRSDFDIGVLDQEPVFFQGPMVFAIELPFSNHDFETFRGFLRHRLGDGEKWFSTKFFHGESYRDIDTRFVKGSLAYSRSGDDWIVKAQQEIRDFYPRTQAHVGNDMVGADPISSANNLRAALLSIPRS